MTIKLFIPKIAFDPELGKKQNIQVLLNEKNELPSADTINNIRKTLNIDIETGNEFYQDEKTQYLFANIIQNKDKNNDLKSQWHFTIFSQLTPENCIDYEAIRKAIVRLGYKI